MKRSDRIFLVAGLLTLMLPSGVLAESASENYIMWAQAETGGGAYATSANYRAFGSVGDVSEDAGDSAGYHAVQGFQALYEEPYLSMSISDTSIVLSPNPLTSSSVSTGSTTVTVSTNADFGYVLTATETVPFQNASAHAIDDVADGSVTAGAEEFGVAASGTDAAFGDDQAVSGSPLTIASREIWGADRATTATFKVGVSAISNAGDYSGTVTFIATGHF